MLMKSLSLHHSVQSSDIWYSLSVVQYSIQLLWAMSRAAVVKMFKTWYCKASIFLYVIFHDGDFSTFVDYHIECMTSGD